MNMFWGEKDPYFFIPTSLKHHQCNLRYIYFAFYGRGAPWSRKWLGTTWSINLGENILIDGGFSFWLGVLLKSSNLTCWKFINQASNRICQNGKVFAWIIESYDAVHNPFIPSFLSLFKQTLNLKRRHEIYALYVFASRQISRRSSAWKDAAHTK